MKTISVIVPVYNIEKYIGQCIESIIRQTYNKLQIILVDDGSTDSSGKICDIYERKDERITVIHQKNGGLSVARNVGLAAAEGELIGFVDGDDIIHPQMYQHLLTSMEKNGAQIVECCVCDMSESRDVDFSDKKYGSEEIYSGEEALRKLLSINKREKCPRYAVWSKLYTKKIIGCEKFPEGFIHEDYCYDVKIFLKAERYVILKEELYFYRKREESITTSAFSNRDLDKLIQIRQSVVFLIKQGYMELAELAKRNYYMTLFLYYAKAKQSNNEEIALQMKNSLLVNKEIILGLALPIRLKIENHIFFISPSFYYTIYIFKQIIKKCLSKNI